MSRDLGRAARAWPASNRHAPERFAGGWRKPASCFRAASWPRGWSRAPSSARLDQIVLTGRPLCGRLSAPVQRGAHKGAHEWAHKGAAQTCLRASIVAPPERPERPSLPGVLASWALAVVGDNCHRREEPRVQQCAAAASWPCCCAQQPASSGLFARGAELRPQNAHCASKVRLHFCVALRGNLSPYYFRVVHSRAAQRTHCSLQRIAANQSVCCTLHTAHCTLLAARDSLRPLISPAALLPPGSSSGASWRLTRLLARATSALELGAPSAFQLAGRKLVLICVQLAQLPPHSRAHLWRLARAAAC